MRGASESLLSVLTSGAGVHPVRGGRAAAVRSVDAFLRRCFVCFSLAVWCRGRALLGTACSLQAGVFSGRQWLARGCCSESYGAGRSYIRCHPAVGSSAGQSRRRLFVESAFTLSVRCPAASGPAGWSAAGATRVLLSVLLLWASFWSESVLYLMRVRRLLLAVASGLLVLSGWVGPSFDDCSSAALIC